MSARSFGESAGSSLSTRIINVCSAVAVAVAAVALPTAAWAQSAGVKPAATGNAAQSDESLTEIVITGTLIRGTEAVGSQTIALDSSQIAQKGAMTTNEVLSLIPQIGNTFNGRTEGDPRGIGANISINKPNLRNLPGFNSASGGLTLVLMDGARFTPIGVLQSGVDVDVIPAAVLQGVDVLTDGGSSLYGADAVAGVLNFRTMKKFDGVKVDANYGMGTTISDYKQWDVALTAGTSWGRGNGYVSIGHSDRDEILNGDTSWATGDVYSAAGVKSFTGTQCISPISTVIRYFKFGATDTSWTNNPLAPGAGTFPASGTPCDTFAAGSYVPKMKRDNIFASMSQSLADNVDLRVTAYYTKRDVDLSQYPRGYSAPAPAPVFPVGAPIGTLFTSPGSANFSFGANAAYDDQKNTVTFQTWGVTPELDIKLGGGWQLSNTLHFGRSFNAQHFPGVNQALTQSYINAGQLNPLNVAAASASVIAGALDYESSQETIQHLVDFRSVADGPVFSLPGGMAKVAVGVEYQSPTVSTRQSAGTRSNLGTLPFLRSERTTQSAFAELSMPLTRMLDVAASLRYDNYSDFGTTTNPNIGFNLKPTSWLKVYGHWNKSFNAPNPIDSLPLAVGRVVPGQYVPFSTDPTRRPYDPLHRDNGQGSAAIVLEGPGVGLKPQTAKSWAAGFEVTPVEKLRIGLQYYSIDLSDVLGAVNPADLTTYVTNSSLYVYNPTASYYADLVKQLALLTVPGTTYDQVALIVDRRTSNISKATLKGVDFHVYYDMDVGIGHLSYGLSGTQQTKAETTTSGTTVDGLGIGGSKMQTMAFAGWDRGPLSARLTVNYSGSYKDSGNNNLGVQENVKAFTQANLFLGYEFRESSGLLGGTSLRLNVDNLFEEKPQVINRSSASILNYANWTLGRVVKFGVSKKF